MIFQGDQYFLKFSITEDGVAKTANDYSGVKLKLADLEYEYPNKGIVYDSSIQKWKCFLTQEDTMNLPEKIQAEIKVKIVGTTDYIKNSKVKTLAINKSLFKEIW